MTDKEDKIQTAGDKEQDKEDKKEDTGDKEDQDNFDFTPEQQAKINNMLATERRKERASAAKIKAELDILKSKDLPEAQQHKLKVDELTQKLAKYEAKELAETVADDLKIPKAEQAKYLKYIIATDEQGIKDQLKQLKKDFGANSTGASSNPAKTGKKNPHDEINDFIRGKAGR
jgi:hypothetical protein